MKPTLPRPAHPVKTPLRVYTLCFCILTFLALSSLSDWLWIAFVIIVAIISLVVVAYYYIIQPWNDQQYQNAMTSLEVTGELARLAKENNVPMGELQYSYHQNATTAYAQQAKGFNYAEKFVKHSLSAVSSYVSPT